MFWGGSGDRNQEYADSGAQPNGLTANTRGGVVDAVAVTELHPESHSRKDTHEFTVKCWPPTCSAMTGCGAHPERRGALLLWTFSA